MKVKVRSSSGRQVSVILSDWCACGSGSIIDLDVRSFARLAPPSRGVIKVSVTK
jgi:rare lipoprotein A (peptidoglycan hydrolase)